jgi:hypothetical protein
MSSRRGIEPETDQNEASKADLCAAWCQSYETLSSSSPTE